MKNGTTSPNVSRVILLDTALALGPFLIAFDEAVMVLLIPVLLRDFQTTLSISSLVIILYLFVCSALVPLAGQLVEWWGCRTTMRCGLAAFAAGALVCACSTTMSVLLLGRCVQGIGSAMLCVCAPASARVSDDQSTGNYMIVAMAPMLAYCIAPPLGGLTCHFFGWRWIFLAGLPVCVLGWIASIGMSRDAARQTQRLNWPGITLLALCIGGVILTLNQGDEWGWTSGPILASAAGAALACWLFIVQRRFTTRHKILDFSLFKHPAFLFGNICMFVYTLCLAGADFLYPLFLTRCVGFSLMLVGFVQMFEPIAMLLTSTANSLLVRTRPMVFIASGMMLEAGGIACFVMVPGPVAPWIICLFYALVGIGTALFYAPCLEMIMCAVPRDSTGTGAATMSTVSGTAQLLGVLVIETLFSHLCPTAAGTFILDATSDPSLRGFHVSFGIVAAAVFVGFIVAGWLGILRARSVARQRATAA